jgi:polysaccharide export outer membrane protein
VIAWLIFLLHASWADVPVPATPSADTPVADAAEAEAPREGLSRYRLGPGDVLAITVFGEAEQSGDFPIGEDGDIDYPLLGEVPVEGLTIAGVDEALTSALAARFLRDPQVSIDVKTFKSQTVEVVGAVKAPGEVPLTGSTTLVDVLTAVGWITDPSVTEVRVQHDGKVESIPLDKLIAPGSEPPRVVGGDVIYVPQGVVVYVAGEVAKPGAIAYREGLTVNQAVVNAGGAKQTANLKKVVIVRGGERIDVNYRKIQRGHAKDIVLQANDQIVVPESVF